uniref:DExH-box ATP-dependent RNA helicase DExH11-like n=1 Tax=Dermatophagoides pteronyssinus TaxID=6956 RepID=A0A6P6YD29_DERPT|nr:DExH-box ATP-dependent RNA helicase DExH11-like [Dermatophagoides pteronyssinus]
MASLYGEIGEDIWESVDDDDFVEYATNNISANFSKEYYPEFSSKLKEIESNDYCSNTETFSAINEDFSSTNKIIDNNKLLLRKLWAIENNDNVENFDEIFPVEKRALTYPYELDIFQKRAILCISRYQHILVCAHTGCGKTAVAEYAIAQCKKNNYRTIYTSPIKALSNQKYNDLSRQFDSIGIITGDVCVNKSAQCLIMTTEILRNLLYRRDPMLNEVGAVIFDEVHYISDAARGVIWEECIIMMPSHIILVMLSATISNAKHFANWVGMTKQKEVFIIRTSKRVVPLIHYMYFNNKRYQLINNNQQTITQAYKQMYNDLLSYLISTDSLPAVVFCFSRNKVEQLAQKLSPLSNFTHKEKSKARSYFQHALECLSKSDRDLPAVKLIQSLMEKGIGIHHGGMLPILKEITEILVSKKLIKVLFATDTFAMGINMPMRTVVLSELKKHDGSKTRYLQSNEYIQIAGRAGRRGLDNFGHVYILVSQKEPTPLNDLVKILNFKPLALDSKFHLNFSMVLEIQTRSSIDPSLILGSSLNESTRQSEYRFHKHQIKQILNEIDEITNALTLGIDKTKLAEFTNLKRRYYKYAQNAFVHLLHTSKLFKNIFQPGRCSELQIKLNDEKWEFICNDSFIPIAYNWANGHSFQLIKEYTTLNEGLIKF